MKKLLVCAALMVLIPRPSWADPKQDFSEAMGRMQDGIPVLMRTIQVLQREAPQLMDVMQRAAVEAERNGGGMSMPAGKPGEMPSADVMAQKLRGLQSMANMMKQLFPIVSRMKSQLDPAGMRPKYQDPRLPGPGEAPRGPAQQKIPYTPPWSQGGLPKAPDPDLQN